MTRREFFKKTAGGFGGLFAFFLAPKKMIGLSKALKVNFIRVSRIYLNKHMKKFDKTLADALHGKYGRCGSFSFLSAPSLIHRRSQVDHTPKCDPPAKFEEIK